MNKLLNNFFFTLSTFSQIPTKQVDFSEDNTKYTFFFLPLVGLIIGAITYLVYLLLSLVIDEIFIKALLLILLNIIITGGIHLDGFLDSIDAIKSHRSKEEKKRIIKDSRIGAFALIYYTIIMISYFIIYYYLIKLDLIPFIILIPLISRIFILPLVSLNSCEDNDILDYLLNKTIKTKWPIFLLVYLIIYFIIGVLFNLAIINLLILLCSSIIFTFIFNKYYKLHFDDLNGDLCGLYLTTSKLFLPLSIIIYNLI